MSREPSDRTLHDLVTLLRQRHLGAFDELYRRYKDRVWRFLVRLTGSRQTAEDLFQDTWVAAARNAHRLREDTEPLAWLYTIARNKHRNGLRFLVFDQRKRDEFQSAARAASPLPDENAETRRRAAKIAASFAALPAAYQEVLILAVVEGLETRVIASVLGVREDAVRKRLSRARAEIARLSAIELEKTPAEPSRSERAVAQALTPKEDTQ